MTGERRHGARAHDDHGVAMLLVLFWGFGMLVLAMIAGQFVLNLVRPSDEAEASFQAWTAAEAGIEEFRGRIAVAEGGSLTSALTPATNPALAGWVELNGTGSGDPRFTYTVDASRASSAGRMTITSTGTMNGQTRTVVATLAKQTMFDYAYASMYETVAPKYPDYYLGGSQQITRAQAEAWCGNRYWYESGPTSATPNWTAANGPNHRDSAACVGGLVTNWAIGQNVTFTGGLIHTNDVFMLNTNNTNLPTFNVNDVFQGPVESSCPPSTAVSVGCPDNHRWLSGYLVAGKSSYVVDESAGPAVPGWNPELASKIEIRNEGLAVLKAKAKEAGCLFTGPTRLRFYPDGTVVVTSPDTKTANPTTGGIDCGGTALAGDPANPTTVRADALTPAQRGSAFNGVIYVQDVPASTDDPNAWGTTTPPTCVDKSTSKSGFQFPFVVTKTDVEGYVDNQGFPGVAVPGFPEGSANASGNQREKFSTDLGTDSIASSCRQGTIYVEGTYSGRWTVVSEGDIAVTSDLVDATVPSNLRQDRTISFSANRTPVSGWGEPLANSTNAMGLVPDRLLYVYGCSSEKGCTDYQREARTKNLILNLSTVITDGCLTVMDQTLTSDFGRLTFMGSLGQKYRCPLAKPTGNSGYSLYVKYDSRFNSSEPPPFMAELSQEPWRVHSVQEIRPSSVSLPALP